MGHKDFLQVKIKTKKGTLSEGVPKKDIRTGFGIEFVGRIQKEPGKAKTTKDTEF